IKNADNTYLVKKVAGEWLKNHQSKENKLKILERFPIVTYYSGIKERWITPFTDSLDSLIEYAKFNKIDYLVVDTLDFKTYRPKLAFLLQDDFQNKSLNKIKVFQVNSQKVILFKFNY
ncbi:MAG: hypothetical protein PHN31_03055, partial [Candidatus Gracilibacteria bacterium]|nr:hypothetical protein [Candidatus Gracilibacteria bacterium]